MKSMLILLVAVLALSGTAWGENTMISDSQKKEVKEKLFARYPGEEARMRIERGVEQVAAFWRSEDGNSGQFAAFCLSGFVADPAPLQQLVKRSEFYFEKLYGNYNRMGLDLKEYLDLDWGAVLPIDSVFGGFNPAAHLSEDLFKVKVAFLSLLNFPRYTLEEKIKLGPQWSREQWAQARLGDLFSARVPADVRQKISEVMTAADAYISEYNVMMGSLRDNDGKPLFPAGKNLISHWGIRDELKAWYGQPLDQALPRQRMIYRLMERIVSQEIPQVVINNPTVLWNPYSNEVFRLKGVSAGMEKETQGIASEPDRRYSHWLATFQAMRLLDPYYPHLPTHVRRSFEAVREIPEAQIESLFRGLLGAPEINQTAKLIRKRLGRKLEPFDIWYTGFKPKGSISEAELDRMTKAKYPTVAAFQADLVRILRELGFSPESASYIAGYIQVDPARGSGHAAGADMKSDKARLRTRFDADGMNYKGYNIAVHELGHTVEQTLTLQKMDSYFMRGVPNTSFTEAFAFAFQYHDLELLGLESRQDNAADMKALDSLWNAYEIAGVSLVDMKAWNWLYAHPQANPAEFKAAVRAIAREVWNQYFADVLGKKDQDIFAIYSHMIHSTLYLPDYAIGHLIEFQIDRYLQGKKLGPEMERMCSSGLLIPQLWMKKAIGSEISAQPLLQAAAQALGRLR